MGGCLKALGRP